MPSRRMPAGMNPGPSPQPTGLGAGRPGSNAQTMPPLPPMNAAPQLGQAPAMPQQPSMPMPQQNPLQQLQQNSQGAVAQQDQQPMSNQMLDSSMILRMMSEMGK